MESWNRSFKVEAVHGERFNTRSEAKHQVSEYIEVYYLCPCMIKKKQLIRFLLDLDG
jgi:hypothetical protein